MTKEETRASMLELCWVSTRQHFVLTVCPDWPHVSQNKFLRYPTNTASLCDANPQNIDNIAFKAVFTR